MEEDKSEYFLVQHPGFTRHMTRRTTHTPLWLPTSSLVALTSSPTAGILSYNPLIYLLNPLGLESDQVSKPTIAPAPAPVNLPTTLQPAAVLGSGSSSLAGDDSTEQTEMMEMTANN